MKIKLKQANLVDCTDKKVTIYLLIQKKDKTFVEIVELKKEKGSVIDLFDDFWHSIEIEGEYFDMNIWNVDRGLLKVALYKLKDVIVDGKKHVETETSSFTSCRLKLMPLGEYELSK